MEPYIVLDTYVFCDDCWTALIVYLTLVLFEMCRIVWLLDDYYDTRHRAYFMSEKQRVIIKVVCILNFVFISNTHAPYVIF